MPSLTQIAVEFLSTTFWWEIFSRFFEFHFNLEHISRIFDCTYSACLQQVEGVKVVITRLARFATQYMARSGIQLEFIRFDESCLNGEEGVDGGWNTFSRAATSARAIFNVDRQKNAHYLSISPLSNMKTTQFALLFTHLLIFLPFFPSS